VYIHCNFCLNLHITHGDMEENVSGFFFLNTVYMAARRLDQCYWWLWRRSCQPISRQVQNNQPSQPITWLILTKLNITTTKKNTKTWTTTQESYEHMHKLKQMKPKPGLVAFSQSNQEMYRHLLGTKAVIVTSTWSWAFFLLSNVMCSRQLRYSMLMLHSHELCSTSMKQYWMASTEMDTN